MLLKLSKAMVCGYTGEAVAAGTDGLECLTSDVDFSAAHDIRLLEQRKPVIAVN